MTGWFDVSDEREHLHLSKIEIKNEFVEVYWHNKKKRLMMIVVCVLQITYTIEVSSAFHWVVKVQGKVLNMSTSTIPVKLDSIVTLTKAIQFLESCHFCVGNEDERFVPLHTARKGIFFG